MPTREEIVAGLATSQSQVIAYFQGLSTHDLERPATTNDVPGAPPWRAKDHLAHLVQHERSIQPLLRHALAGDPPDEILRMQYPPDVPLPRVLGDLDALTPEELEQLELAIARINQSYLDAHRDDTLEELVAEYQVARLELLDLLNQFSDEQLAAVLPSVVGEATAGEIFAGRAGHADEHIASIEEGWRQRG